MTASIFFIKPLFSKQASAPTKLGELLACGVPCLSNSGVGDMASILNNEQVGLTISSFDRHTLSTALQSLLKLSELPGIRARCAHVASKYFSLEEGVSLYSNVYESLVD